MANWITHMMIVDRLLDKGISLHRRGFVVGNVAPDCNVENEDWTAFVPTREETHFMTGKKKTEQDYMRFYQLYLQDRKDSSTEEYAFLVGYFIHLVVDVKFQEMIRDEQRVQRCYERLQQEVDLYQQMEHLPHTFDTLKQVFGKQRLFQDLLQIEQEYLRTHLCSSYHELCKIQEFPEYLDMFPKGAIVRKIPIMLSEYAIDIPKCKDVFFSKKEYDQFVEKVSAFIYQILQRYGVIA